MSRYAILIGSSFNRVYAEASVRLTVSELDVFNHAALEGRLSDIAEERIGGIPYVSFEADRLDNGDVALLSNMSSLRALRA